MKFRYDFSGPYRQPYACFDCRKCFHSANWERKLSQVVTHLCPECRQPMHRMGVDFKAPRHADIRQWGKIQMLSAHGFIYAPYGSGPGHRPKHLSEVPNFLQEVARHSEEIKNWNRRGAKIEVREAKRKERERRKLMRPGRIESGSTRG